MMQRIWISVFILMTLNAWSQPAHFLESFGYEEMPSEKGAIWTGRIAAPSDPIVVLDGYEIHADREKHLKMRLSLEGAQSIQIFFSAGKDEAFNEPRSFRVYGWITDGEWHDYVLNLESVPEWRGPIRRLRVDLEGAPRGAVLRLGEITAHAMPVEADEVLAAFGPSAQMHDRMAAHNETIVATNEAQPNSALLSQIHSVHSPFHQALLARIVPGIENGGGESWSDQARNVEVQDFPGGVRARFEIAESEITTEFVPLFVGADTQEDWDGAALYRVTHSGAGNPVLRVGGSGVAYFHSHPARVMVGTRIPADNCLVDLDGERALLASSDWPLQVAVHAPGASLAVINGQYLRITLPAQGGDILFAYAEEREKALALLEKDINHELDRVRERYRQLLATAYIQTPDANMNAAFQSAIRILEYAWLPPYGWTESIHHWLALWHNQHSPFAEWLGQEERSRQCLLAHAENLMPDGAVPQFSAGGHKRRDFGGSNQFYFWQVRHYWKQTADKDTLRLIAPKLDAIIDQTWREYDPDGDGLLAWGKQIGNQEDFVSTPYDGTVPTIEGINMLQTRAIVADALEDSETARRCRANAAALQESLCRVLWMPGLGRYAYYKDPTGILALEGPYQAFAYPIIFEQSGPLEAWSGLRHFRDRLVSPEGRAYCTNHFASHADGIHATWGMQGGAAQQPWAAWALAKAGLRNEAWKPLHIAATWVMSDFQKGAWPEVSTEKRRAYFTPPAALYGQAVIEAVFGLNLDRPANTLVLSPAFPDAWPEARLALPDFQATYERKQNGLLYTVESREPLTRLLRWKLPPNNGVQLRVNGKKHEATQSPGVACMELCANIPASQKTQIEITWNPLTYHIEQPGSIAVGEHFYLKPTGVRVRGIEDPASVLEGWRVTEDAIQARARPDALDMADGYGPLGAFNFSRRSFFLLCETKGGIPFYHPVDLTLLPRYEARALTPLQDNGVLRFLTRNNTQQVIEAETILRIGNRSLPLNLKLAPRSEQPQEVPLPQELLLLLAPGDNPATWILPDAQASVPFRFEAKDMVGTRYAVESIPLPVSQLVSDTQWADARPNYAWYHAHENHPPLLAGLPIDEPILAPGLSAIPFELSGAGDFPGERSEARISSFPTRNVLPLSHKSGQPCVRIPLDCRPLRKVYLLVAGLLENHDMYMPIARVSVHGKNPETSLQGEQRGEPVISRVLHYPGDLDSFYPNHLAATMFSTLPYEKRDRFFLPPLLTKQESDWTMARPSQFPQPALWSSSRVISGTNAHFNVIEIDLGHEGFPATAIEMRALTTDAAVAVVAITVLVDTAGTHAEVME